MAGITRIFKRSPVDARKKCRVCGEESPLISQALGVCASCIRERPDEASLFIEEAHASTRRPYGLPSKVPKGPGISCGVCSNECRIGEGEKGFCGLRENRDGKLHQFTSPRQGLLYMYLDPHVTNCCSAWFCPAGTGVGYPQYAYGRGPERGYYNLAVFFYGCNFDCLFCQNASHKEISRGEEVEVEDFSELVENNKRISCICFFGGSPEPQLPFALETSRTILKKNQDRILRICFEWNGCGNPKLVKEAAKLALASGGNLKFDLKCFNPNMSLALSGASNQRAYENFRMIAEELYSERPGPPVLTATTLLVPGYVDAAEVDQIARFIADFNDEIPYSLLIFHPAFRMQDLPITPMKQVTDCYRAAKKHLRRVNVGNLHLIGVRSLSELERII